MLLELHRFFNADRSQVSCLSCAGVFSLPAADFLTFFVNVAYYSNALHATELNPFKESALSRRAGRLT